MKMCVRVLVQLDNSRSAALLKSKKHTSLRSYIYVYMHGVLSNLSDGDIFFFPLCFANVTFVTTIRSCFYSSTLLPVISAIQTEENCPFLL